MTRYEMTQLQEGDRVRGIWREPDGTGETAGGVVCHVADGGWIKVEWDNRTIQEVVFPKTATFELHRVVRP